MPLSDFLLPNSFGAAPDALLDPQTTNPFYRLWAARHPPTLTPQTTMAPGLQDAGAALPTGAAPTAGAIPTSAGLGSVDPRARAQGELSGDDPALKHRSFAQNLLRGLGQWAMGGLPALLTMNQRERDQYEGRVDKRTAQLQQQEAFKLAQAKAAHDAEKDRLEIGIQQETLKDKQAGQYVFGNDGRLRMNTKTGVVEVNPGWVDTSPTPLKPGTLIDVDDPKHKGSFLKARVGEDNSVTIIPGTEHTPPERPVQDTITEDVMSGDMEAWRARGRDLDSQIAATNDELAKFGTLSKKDLSKLPPERQQYYATLQGRLKTLNEAKETWKTADKPTKVSSRTRKVPVGQGGASGSTRVAPEPTTDQKQRARLYAQRYADTPADAVVEAGPNKGKNKRAVILATARAEGLDIGQ